MFSAQRSLSSVCEKSGCLKPEWVVIALTYDLETISHDLQLTVKVKLYERCLALHWLKVLWTFLEQGEHCFQVKEAKLQTKEYCYNAVTNPEELSRIRLARG